MNAKEDPAQTEYVRQVTKQMNENKAPGQKGGNKQGFTIAKIVNPHAPNKIYKGK